MFEQTFLAQPSSFKVTGERGAINSYACIVNSSACSELFSPFAEA
jgi:hypothetical protein